MTFEDDVIQLSRLANQLYGDLQTAPNEQAALQLIADAFEKVGEIAIAEHILTNDGRLLEGEAKANNPLHGKVLQS